MTETLQQLYYWPKMAEEIKQHVGYCKSCQINKKVRKEYGKIPVKEAEESLPWNRVNVDMMGPLTVTTATGKKKLLVLTMINPATGWFEVKELHEAFSGHVSEVLDNV